MSQGSSEKKSENKKITILVIICSILGLAAVGVIIFVAVQVVRGGKSSNESTEAITTADTSYVARDTSDYAPLTTATVLLTEAPATEAPTTEEITTEEATTVLPDGTKFDRPTACGSLYILDGQLFNPNCSGHGTGDYYASMVNSVGSKIPANAQLYNLVAPTAFGACLSVQVQEDMVGGNQPELIEYIYSQIDPGNAITVPAYKNIIRHNAEYIYFNTDHHWTQLGAYYAYQSWCEAKGIKAHQLDYFKTKYEVPGYYGYFYGLSSKPKELDDGDTVVGYVPNGTNDMVYTDRDGNKINWDVVRDYTGRNGSYVCFIAGDQPFVKIENPEIQDGSSCILIKESYGNAFAPFLVDHYQYVYVVDYRYYTANVNQLIKEQPSNVDVIILNNLEAIGSTRCDQINNLFR